MESVDEHVDKGRHIYTFENICKEDPSIFLKDETTKIFLNAYGKQDDVSKELKAFLDYVAGKKSEDIFVKKLEEAVKKAKKNREWRLEYMTLLMRDQENVEKGIQQGIITMIENALKATRSVSQTSNLLQLDKEMVRKVACDRGIGVSDL